MGFRSVFITEDKAFDLPPWFFDKWRDCFHFRQDDKGKLGLPISSKIEQKMHHFSDDFHQDLQKLIDDKGVLVLIWLHECGGMTRVEIHKQRILYSEPEGWEKTDGSTHSYCYGCSDHPDIQYERTHCVCGGKTVQGDACIKCG